MKTNKKTHNKIMTLFFSFKKNNILFLKKENENIAQQHKTLLLE